MEIVVDVTCDLPEKYKNKVRYIPAYIIKGNKKIKIDEKFNSIKNFYENDKLKSLWLEGKLKTSQPSIKDIIDVINKIDDEEILIITASKRYTGIYNVVKNATRFIKEKKIYVYDSGTVSVGMSLLVEELINKLERENLDIREAIQFLNKLKVTIYGVPVDIGFLFKSGRINIIKYAFLKVINKKPLLKLERYKEVEFVKLVESHKELYKMKGEKVLWGADYFNFNEIPEPKVLLNPSVVINTGPIIMLGVMKGW